MKRLCVIFMAMLSMSIFLVGCGGGAQQSVQQSTLDKVLKTKELNVAVILSFPPFGSKNQNGEPEGYDVDMAKALADSLGAKINIIEVTSANRIPYLETGKADIVFGNFTRNLERAQKIGFSNPYVAAGETMLVKKGSGIQSVKDLEGKSVAVVKGSTNGDIVKKMAPTADIRFFDT